MLARRPSDVLDNLVSRFLQWSGLLSHLRSYERYDEPETLPYSIHPVCPMSADGGHRYIFIAILLAYLRQKSKCRNYKQQKHQPSMKPHSMVSRPTGSRREGISKTALLTCPGEPEQGGSKRVSSCLIAAPDCAPAAVISINGHGPAATTVPPVIGIVVIGSPSVMALTITWAANVDPDAARANVYALSQGCRRSCRSHSSSESE